MKKLDETKEVKCPECHGLGWVPNRGVFFAYMPTSCPVCKGKKTVMKNE